MESLAAVGVNPLAHRNFFVFGESLVFQSAATLKQLPEFRRRFAEVADFSRDQRSDGNAVEQGNAIPRQSWHTVVRCQDSDQVQRVSGREDHQFLLRSGIAKLS